MASRETAAARGTTANCPQRHQYIVVRLFCNHRALQELEPITKRQSNIKIRCSPDTRLMMALRALKSAAEKNPQYSIKLYINTGLAEAPPLWGCCSFSQALSCEARLHPRNPKDVLLVNRNKILLSLRVPKPKSLFLSPCNEQFIGW